MTKPGQKNKISNKELKNLGIFVPKKQKRHRSSSNLDMNIREEEAREAISSVNVRIRVGDFHIEQKTPGPVFMDDAQHDDAIYTISDENDPIYISDDERDFIYISDDERDLIYISDNENEPIYISDEEEDEDF